MLKRNLPYPGAVLADRNHKAVDHAFYVDRCSRCIEDGVLTCWTLISAGKSPHDPSMLMCRPYAVLSSVILNRPSHKAALPVEPTVVKP